MTNIVVLDACCEPFVVMYTVYNVMYVLKGQYTFQSNQLIVVDYNEGKRRSKSGKIW